MFLSYANQSDDFHCQFLSNFFLLRPTVSHILTKSNKLYGTDSFNKREAPFYHEIFLTFVGLSQGAVSTCDQYLHVIIRLYALMASAQPSGNVNSNNVVS